ncbi:MAG: 3-deoxy-8-phosphooctulonate synthase, partial [Deltaproteobacteria bacterium]|nr:3-deoxy-8-phosphooctulonate synthase [Deltaproteobacteria bacterium]
MGYPVHAGRIKIEEKGPFFIIAGPCVIESEETTMRVALFLKEASEKLDIPVIFKTSYDKANRTSVASYRGPGIEKGLEIIMKVKEKTSLPVLSDIHSIDD